MSSECVGIARLTMELTRPQAELLLTNFYLTGGGGIFVENKPFVRGGGFADILSSIGKVALPLLKNVGKYIGKTGVALLANTAKDALDGKNLGNSLKNNASAALENAQYDLTQNIARRLTGKRKKRKKTRPRKKSRNMW